MMDNHVQYRPGEEPVNVQKRLKTLFEKLDTAYPDKNVFGLNRLHKKWGETVTELYRILGYADSKSFLAAYGYTVIEVSGGRPGCDYNAIIVELKTRYPNGPTCSALGDFIAENPDLSSQFSTLKAKAPQWFGMPLAKYLIEQDLLIGKKKEACEDSFATLRTRYENQPFSGSQKELMDANSDLDWEAVQKYYLGSKSALSFKEFLIEQGILAAQEKHEWDDKTVEDNLAWITDELKKRYPEGQIYNGNVTQLERENPNLPIARLSDWVKKVYHETAVEYLTRIGLFQNAEGRLNQTIEELKRRYGEANGQPTTIKEYADQNPDLPVSLMKDWIRKLYKMDCVTYFKKQGLLPEIENPNDDVAAFEEDDLSFEEYTKLYLAWVSDQKNKKAAQKQEDTETAESLSEKAKAEYDRLRDELEKAFSAEYGKKTWVGTDDAYVNVSLKTDEITDRVFTELCQYAGSAAEFWDGDSLVKFLKKETGAIYCPCSFGYYEPVCVVLALAAVMGKLHNVNVTFYHDKWEARGDAGYEDYPSHVKIQSKNNAAVVYVDRHTGEDEEEDDGDAQDDVMDEYTPEQRIADDFSDDRIELFLLHLTKNPTIVIPGNAFAFTGIMDENVSHFLVREIVKRGGIRKTVVSKFTEYLIVSPKHAGGSKLVAALKQREKGHNVQIILINDMMNFLINQK